MRPSFIIASGAHQGMVMTLARYVHGGAIVRYTHPDSLTNKFTRKKCQKKSKKKSPKKKTNKSKKAVKSKKNVVPLILQMTP